MNELAVVHGKVTLSSGREADYYVDLRRATLHHEAGPLIGVLLRQLTADWDFDAVGGLTLGADPVATAMMHAPGQPLNAFVVRKEAKAHGMQRQIEGPDVTGRRVLVVEDTTTTGASPLKAVEALRGDRRRGRRGRHHRRPGHRRGPGARRGRTDLPLPAGAGRSRPAPDVTGPEQPGDAGTNRPSTRVPARRNGRRPESPGRRRPASPSHGRADPRLDPELLAGGDTRNVIDRYRYWRREAIVADLDTRRHPLHVAIENFGHDMNIGTVVRTANAFAVAAVHIVGRRRWNRRGAMVTDRYQHIEHHPDVASVVAFAAAAGLSVVAVDNLPGAVPIETTDAAAGVPAAVRPGIDRADRRGAGAGRPDGVDRPVRLDPVDQCRGRGRHRDARLDPAARRSRHGLADRRAHPSHG